MIYLQRTSHLLRGTAGIRAGVTVNIDDIQTGNSENTKLAIVQFWRGQQVHQKAACLTYTNVNTQKLYLKTKLNKFTLNKQYTAQSWAYVKSHVKNLPGTIKTNKGRPTTIIQGQEVKLVNALKTFEKQRFGMSRREVLELDRTYVAYNKIETQSKDRVPREAYH